MIRYENQCVGCPPERGCTKPHCKYWNVPVWVCDKCGEEDTDLYDYEGQELCEYCLLQTVPKVHHE